MRIAGTIWLDSIVEKLQQKHAVQQHEVEETLEGRTLFRLVEKGHRPGENVYAALGRSAAGRYLTVFFVE